jgi:uncharacterized protein YqfA (UPF0365 family)
MARAQAERRRAEAIATEQVMKAKVAENRANLVLAESEIPRALGKAFAEGRLLANQAHSSLEASR